jgi:hypothetical protein
MEQIPNNCPGSVDTKRWKTEHVSRSSGHRKTTYFETDLRYKDGPKEWIHEQYLESWRRRRRKQKRQRQRIGAYGNGGGDGLLEERTKEEREGRATASRATTLLPLIFALAAQTLTVRREVEEDREMGSRTHSHG